MVSLSDRDLLSFRREFDADLAALDWSQADLARALGVHVNTVSGWATGRTAMPGTARAYLNLAVRIAGLLDGLLG